MEGRSLDHIQKARNRRRETLDVIFQLFPVLAERQHQMAGTLSGGEQQMLATARALMARPSLLMTDEPAWGLALLLVHRLCDTIGQINQQGCTVLLVEQHVHQVLSMAGRGYVLERGVVVMEGEGRQLLKKERLKESYLGI